MVPEHKLPGLFAWATKNQLALFPIHKGAKALGTARYTDGSSCVYPFAKPLEMASFDPVDWRAWYDRFNGCNFGVAVTPSHLIVVDIDTDDNGEPYTKEWYDWLETHDTPSHDTLIVRTPSGGLHLYYRITEKNLRQPDLVPGKINIRANNGYVVAPFSELWPTVVGIETPGRYSLHHDEPITKAFPALIEHCRPRSFEPTRIIASNDLMADDGLPRDHGRRWYAERMLRDTIDRLLRAEEGTRNHTLNICAVQLGHWVAAGYMDESRVVADLATAADTIGLTPEETHATSRSGLETGMKEPIALPRSALTDLAAVASPLPSYLGHPPLPPAASLEALPTALKDRPLVEKLAIAGNVTILAGKYGTGKTTLIMCLAYADIAGMRHFMREEDFAPHNNPVFTQPCGWVVCSFENAKHLDLLGNAFNRGHGVESRHPERLRLMDLQEPLVRAVGRNVLSADTVWKAIAEEASTLRDKLQLPVTVILDNTAAAISNRSDEEQAKMFMACSHGIAKQGHAVIGIAHPTKNGSSSIAGSSIFFDLADCVAELETVDATPAGWVQWLHFSKFRGPNDGMGMLLRSRRLPDPIHQLPDDWGAGNYGFYRRQLDALRLPYITSIEVLPNNCKPSNASRAVPPGESDTIKIPVPNIYMPQ